MVRKWMCKACGAIHDGKEAVDVMLSTIFIPVKVEEKPKEEVVKPDIPEGYVKGGEEFERE